MQQYIQRQVKNNFKTRSFYRLLMFAKTWLSPLEPQLSVLCPVIYFQPWFSLIWDFTGSHLWVCFLSEPASCGTKQPQWERRRNKVIKNNDGWWKAAHTDYKMLSSLSPNRLVSHRIMSTVTHWELCRIQMSNMFNNCRKKWAKIRFNICFCDQDVD